jgi:hypothetical protein
VTVAEVSAGYSLFAVRYYGWHAPDRASWSRAKTRVRTGACAPCAASAAKAFPLLDDCYTSMPTARINASPFDWRTTPVLIR